MLAISIALPVLVVVLFAAATFVPRLYTDPPAHDLLVTVEYGDSSRLLPVKVLLGIEGSRVVARVARLGQYEQGYLPRLYRYSHQSGSVREINIPLPQEIEALGNGEEIPIPELQGVGISSELVAPDGYEFRGRSGRGGLLMDVFGAARDNRRITVAKNGAVVRIRLPESNYGYYGARFLGWVVGTEDQGSK